MRYSHNSSNKPCNYQSAQDELRWVDVDQKEDAETPPKYHSYSIKETLTVAIASEDFNTPPSASGVCSAGEPDYLNESFENDKKMAAQKEKEAEVLKKQIPKIALNFTKWKLQ